MAVLPDITADLGALMPQLRGRMSANASMADLCWFRAGGVAQVLFTPADEADLAYFLTRLPQDIPVLTVGLGSNLLVREGGFAGVIIRLSLKGFGAVVCEGGARISAGTALRDKSVAEAALKADIGGLEFYYGIPGSIGGALRMNAGANGFETKDVLVLARAVDRAGHVHMMSNEEMRFSYRSCGAAPDLIFTQALFEGRPEPQEVIAQRMAEVAHHRESVQPVKERTGGSTFKNPDGLSAWKLIDAAGLRGFRVGGAHMSHQHCNFLINDQNATAYDIECLGEQVRERVKDHSGVELQWEIKRIGAFLPHRGISSAF